MSYSSSQVLGSSAGGGGQFVDGRGLVDGTADHQRIADLSGRQVHDPQDADRLFAGAGDDEVVEAAFDHSQECVADQGVGTDRGRGERGERGHRGVGVDATGGQPIRKSLSVTMPI